MNTGLKRTKRKKPARPRTIADAAEKLNKEKAKYEKLLQSGDKYQRQEAELKLKRIQLKLSELKNIQQSMNGNLQGSPTPAPIEGGNMPQYKYGVDGPLNYPPLYLSHLPGVFNQNPLLPDPDPEQPSASVQGTRYMNPTGPYIDQDYNGLYPANDGGQQAPANADDRTAAMKKLGITWKDVTQPSGNSSSKSANPGNTNTGSANAGNANGLLASNGDGTYGNVDLKQFLAGAKDLVGNSFDINSTTDVKALQDLVGADQDGKVGPQTYNRMMNYRMTRVGTAPKKGISKISNNAAAGIKKQAKSAKAPKLKVGDNEMEYQSLNDNKLMDSLYQMAPFLENMVNQQIIDKMPDAPAPIMQRQRRAPDDVRLDNARVQADRKVKTTQDSLKHSKADAGVASNAALAGLAPAFDLYGSLSEKEALINQRKDLAVDQMNAGIDASNVQRGNAFLQQKLEREDMKLSNISANTANMFGDLAKRGYEDALRNLDRDKLKLLVKQFDKGVISRNFYNFLAKNMDEAELDSFLEANHVTKK